MKLGFNLIVRIKDADAGSVFKISTYGLAAGLGLVDKIREKFPDSGAVESFSLQEWEFMHIPGLPKASGLYPARGDGKWTIPISEEQAKASGRFTDSFFAYTEMTKAQFKEVASLRISSTGATPEIDSRLVYEIWEGSGFACEAEQL